MTSEEFKKDTGLVKAWRELRENETLKMVLEIAASEGPISERPIDSDTASLVHYGKILGYSAFSAKLTDLATYNEAKPHPKRNYARKPE